mmetsp:Transcript_12027/g.15682  ORF Transcript_12027/g.15682 Transcript_12027/m.15682 type:complete len:506 (+) Transcript_12027:97-1614(+)|eukprot:CAMPEP_0116075516 /NCGR_PEP_ID=MMETSP0322-20121206/16676_1 /TAXON_ID=163516 /ORGANISM="Leptocylindrus danicus var. apora, Strain B651" /LENGTH=505 /DNA_ID=CAMNT_0003565579 /DNA_START=342 /DNA_END=1859 /DNA_ORIENTATION=+
MKRKRYPSSTLTLPQPSFTNDVADFIGEEIAKHIQSNFERHCDNVEQQQQQQHLRSEGVEDVFASPTKNLEAVSSSSNKKKNERGAGVGGMSMDQCVAILEPHLEAFRRLNEANDEKRRSNKVMVSKNGAMEDCSNVKGDEVPPQLLRLCRFFKIRWEPIRHALLRPASKDELIEVGVRDRVRLAVALQKKGFIAMSELDDLTISFLGDSCGSEGIADFGDNKEVDLSVSLERLFHRLPLEAATSSSDFISTSAFSAAVRHIRSILKRYCEQVEHVRFTSRIDTIENESSVPMRFCPREVAQMALASYNSIVATKGFHILGIDKSHHIANSDEIYLGTERTFARFLFGNKESSDMSVVTNEIQVIIQNLLSPSMLGQLNEIQIFSISRFLSHLEDADALTCVAASIESNLSSNDISTSLAFLPKIISLLLIFRSVYKSSTKAKRTNEISTLTSGVVKNFEKQLQGEIDKGYQKKKRMRGISNLRSTEYVALIFQTIHFLVNHSKI